MSNGDDQQFGKLIALSEEHGKQLDKLFDKVEYLADVMSKQIPLIEKNGIGLKHHDTRICALERIRWYLIVGGVIILCAIFGIDKVTGFLEW